MFHTALRCANNFLTTATGIGLLIESAKPGATFGQAPVIDFGTPFWSLSVALTIICTILIGGKMIQRRQVAKSSGRVGDSFLVDLEIFAESAALYAIAGIIYIPLFARDIPLQFPFSSLLGSASVNSLNNSIIYHCLMSIHS